MRSISKTLQALVVLTVTGLQVACGNTGPLVLPEDSVQKQATPMPTAEQQLKTETTQGSKK